MFVLKHVILTSCVLTLSTYYLVVIAIGATQQENLLNDLSAFYRYTKAFDREPIFVDLEVHFVEILHMFRVEIRRNEPSPR